MCCSTSDTRRTSIVKQSSDNLGGKDGVVITTNETHPWSSVTHTFRIYYIHFKLII